MPRLPTATATLAPLRRSSKRRDVASASSTAPAMSAIGPPFGWVRRTRSIGGIGMSARCGRWTSGNVGLSMAGLPCKPRRHFLTSSTGVGWLANAACRGLGDNAAHRAELRPRPPAGRSARRDRSAGDPQAPDAGAAGPGGGGARGARPADRGAAAGRARAGQEERLHPDLRHHAAGAERPVPADPDRAAAGCRAQPPSASRSWSRPACIARTKARSSPSWSARAGCWRRSRSRTISRATMPRMSISAPRAHTACRSSSTGAWSRPTSRSRPAWSSRTSWPAGRAGAR